MFITAVKQYVIDFEFSHASVPLSLVDAQFVANDICLL